MKRHRSEHIDLHELAEQAMREHGFLPDFSPEVRRQIQELGGPANPDGDKIADLRHLLFFSIDNDDSRDLDQLTYAEQSAPERIRVWVAVADVDACVKKGTPIDERARHNTTSIYTAGGVFAMLPEELSTDWTSLNEGVDRLAVVAEFVVLPDGSVEESQVYRAVVHNHAKLAYNNVAAFYEGNAELPQKLPDMKPMQEQIRLQIKASDQLRELRHERGALDLQTIEARPVFGADGKVTDLYVDLKNEAKELIEDFMITANGIVARFLDDRRLPVFRRVVKTPERWSRIVELARSYGEDLQAEPDPAALEAFLKSRRKKDPLRFPDVSLSVVKLLGRGEYIIDPPGGEPPGHFGLAVRDYSHSTAPNRRYPDLITQRMVKATLAGQSNPYTLEELNDLAAHCTERENDSNKVERTMRKAAAALILADRVGEKFEGIVTGASSKGTWVRIFKPPVEGKLLRGWKGLDVGDRVTVRLEGTDPERGFIDFSR